MQVIFLCSQTAESESPEVGEFTPAPRWKSWCEPEALERTQEISVSSRRVKILRKDSLTVGACFYRHFESSPG